jgi:AcrR family transcriptional regulator
MEQKLSKAEKTLNRILDAALTCYERFGISGTRLDEVSRVAGIGRTTLYRYVNNREDLLNKVILRDARQQQAEMAVLNRYYDSFADSLVETVILVMRGRRTRPINKLLFSGEENALIDRINLSPSSFYDMVEGLLAPQFELAQAQGELRDGVKLKDASRWLSRVILSLVTYPGEFLQDEAALRTFLGQFLVPSLIEEQRQS